MNKKIKVIELLNKIANNEKLPVKIMFNTVAWELMKDEKDYRSTHTQERLLKDDNWILRHLNVEVEILEDEEDNDISSLNAFKLMEAPYMAKCLDKNSHEEFMEHLKQSEVEIVHKIGELIEKVNKIDRKINKED